MKLACLRTCRITKCFCLPVAIWNFTYGWYFKRSPNSSHDALFLHFKCCNIFTFGRLLLLLLISLLPSAHLIPSSFFLLLFFLPFPHILWSLYVNLHSCIKRFLSNPFRSWVIVFTQPVYFLLVLFYSVFRKRKLRKMDAVGQWLLVGGCSYCWGWYATVNRTSCCLAA